jgi:hypothetical protein
MAIWKHALAIAVSGLCGWLAVSSVHADHPQLHNPVKVDAQFQWRFTVKVGYGQFHLAPWYAYFPADTQSGGWPVQLPMGHVGQQGGPLPGMGAGAGPQPGAAFTGPAPSYWYGPGGG